MNRKASFCCLALLSTVMVSCSGPVRGTQPASESYMPVPGAVAFDIKHLPSKKGYEWLATYSARGKTAKFRIELGRAQSPRDEESKIFDVKSGTGRFVAEPGSDASALLNELKTALEAKSLPVQVRRVNALPFTFVSFSSHQSQASHGGFSQTRPAIGRP